MLGIAADTKIFLYGEAVDMRNGFEGLQAIVEQLICEDPTSGAYFVFLNRYHNRIKVLYWDLDGFALWSKRLEKGKFLCDHQGKVSISRRDFFLMLEGITPKRINRRYSLS